MIKSPGELVAEAKKQCRLLTPKEAADIAAGSDEVVVIDVREPGEAAEGALKGSVNIPRGVLEMKIEKAVPAENTPLLLHCAKGGRASLAACALKSMGYTDVSVIDAAFDDIAEAFK